MRRAITLAKYAQACNEVPVGAVLLHGNSCFGGYNTPIKTTDPTAHAEIVAIRRACARLGNYRIPGATLYITLEPCPMCLGAIAYARIARVVFGAYDPKRGAIANALPCPTGNFLNHQITWQGGVLHDTCADLLLEFFQGKRGST